MSIKQLHSNFIISAEKLSQCPTTNLPEFPLIGRSNVGKSSFINALANNKKLAKTSNTPGKTRLINFFNFSDIFMLADLPGYGYAKVSKEAQANWQKHLEEYLLGREQIKCLVQFIDARHAPSGKASRATKLRGGVEKNGIALRKRNANRFFERSRYHFQTAQAMALIIE